MIYCSIIELCDFIHFNVIFRMIFQNQVTLPAQKTRRGTWQTSVYFTGVKKIPFSDSCTLTLPEQKKNKYILHKFLQGGAPPIPYYSWIYQAFLKIWAFKVCLIFFIFFFSFFYCIASTCFNGLLWNLEH